MSTYAEIESPWGALGYICLPGGPDKKPVVGGWGDQPWAGRGILYPRGRRYHSVGGPRPTDDEFQIWDLMAQEAGDQPRALLLPASGSIPLVVIDVDDPGRLAWVVETYGDTPMRVTTGRKGGGVHLYYQMPGGREILSANGVIGPDEALRPDKGTTAIDVKAARGYVVAAGSAHPSGKTYELLWDGEPRDPTTLTLEDLRELPVLEPEVHDRELARGEVRKAAWRASRTSTGQPRQGNHAVHKSTGAVAGGGVDPATPITSETAETFTLATAPPGRYHSPFRHDAHPSCDIWVPPGSGRRQLCDWSTDERWWLDEPRQRRKDEGSGQPPQENATVYKAPTAATGGSPYLPDGALRSDARLFCCPAPQGTGKTHRIGEDLVVPVLERGGTVLDIAHRRSLATIHARRLGLVDYQVVEGELEPTAGVGHAVCLDSLSRCPTYRRLDRAPGYGEIEDVQHDLVVLDEAVSVLLHLFGGTIAKKAGVTKTWRQLREHLQRAKQVDLADADLARCPEAVAIVRDMMGGLRNEEVAWVGHEPPAEPKQAVEYTHLDALVESMIEGVRDGAPIWVYSTTRRDATAVHERLQAVHPDRRGLLITADTIANEDVRAVLNDPAKAEAYDWIVASPSCATAWSYDGDHFQRVYAIARGFRSRDGAPGATALDVFQGVRRVRHPGDSTLRYWVGGDVCSMPTDPGTIADELLRAGRRTGKLIGFETADPDHPRIVRDYARALATRGRWGNHLHDYRPRSDEHHKLDKAARAAEKEANKAMTQMNNRHRQLCDAAEWAEGAKTTKDQRYREGVLADLDAKYEAARATWGRLHDEARQLREAADAARPEISKGALREYLETVGYTISSTIDLPLAPGEHATVKEILRERETQEVAAAPEITTAEADEILDTDKVPEQVLGTMKRTIDPTAPDLVSDSSALRLARKAATRRKLADFYGVEPTAALVERDDEGRYRAKCRRFTWYTLVREGGRDDVEHLDREEVVEDAAQCRHRLAWCQVVKGVLEMYGLDHLEDGAVLNTNPSPADTRKLWTLSRYASIALGLSLAPTERDPLRPLRSVLSSMGLRLQRDTEGRRVLAGVGQVKYDAAAYRRRLVIDLIDNTGGVDLDALLDGLEVAA